VDYLLRQIGFLEVISSPWKQGLLGDSLSLPLASLPPQAVRPLFYFDSKGGGEPIPHYEDKILIK